MKPCLLCNFDAGGFLEILSLIIVTLISVSSDRNPELQNQEVEKKSNEVRIEYQVKPLSHNTVRTNSPNSKIKF